MQHSIIGIDPGIVHTGCVHLLVDTIDRRIETSLALIQGVDVAEVRDWVDSIGNADLFVEDYNPGNYVRENKKMSEALGRLQVEFPPSEADPLVAYVDNAGINTLIPVAVQRLFRVDSFPVSTHHNDLVSAGKIALLGMLKNEELRPVLSQVVGDSLNNKPWKAVLNV